MSIFSRFTIKGADKQSLPEGAACLEKEVSRGSTAQSPHTFLVCPAVAEGKGLFM